MSFQTPITIHDALENIESQKYLLPAIQREFEWHYTKIEWLFDSLMRGYPISSFLFWNVEKSAGKNYKFYKFLRHYRERYKEHNEDASVDGIDNFIAVLDGQQRLTSLNIGLKGSYAFKEYRVTWKDDERNIPTRHLYLNVTELLEYQEDDRLYEFSFLKDADTNLADIYADKWFRVGKILDLKNYEDFDEYLTKQNLPKHSRKILARLQQTVFTDRLINYFLEKEQDLHKALNIFIRVNSGGKPLDFSDLIMSIAIANWAKKDARAEIHGLVDKVQQLGFGISKDLIFKTYLYLYSSDIRFKVTNFSKENAHNFENDWERIRDTILTVFELLRSFGYNDLTLTSKNAAIPIVYYLYHRGIHADFCTAVAHKADREILAKWTHVMTLKRVFGGTSDATLAQIRKAFTEDITKGVKIRPDINQFPVKDIASQIKRDISVGEEFVEELLKTQKDDRYAFSILALLYPQLDYRNNDFHKDHLHPISMFTVEEADTLGFAGDGRDQFLSWEWNNSIINLQMLDANENKSKQDTSLADWVSLETKQRDRETFLRKCLIPTNQDLSLKNFPAFAEARKKLLVTKLTELLA